MSEDASSASTCTAQVAEEQQYVCGVCGNYVKEPENAVVEDETLYHDECHELLGTTWRVGPRSG